MKLNRIITLCAMAATLAISATSLLAQDTPTPKPGGTDGQPRNRTGGGNFDPAQFQQRMVEGTRDRLGFTNDVEWEAVKPIVQKVMEAQIAARSGQLRGLMGGRNRGGNNGDQASTRSRTGFGQPSPEAEALQKALDDNAPAGQVKDLLAKYKAAQKIKQDKLEAAQAELKTVLTTKQEAQAVLLGLVN